MDILFNKYYIILHYLYLYIVYILYSILYNLYLYIIYIVYVIIYYIIYIDI